MTELAQRKERRREPRVQIARPVYVESADLRDQHFKEIHMTRDLSRWSFSFVTEKGSYRLGMQVNAIPPFGCFNMEYECKVVRVDELSTGEFVVAVRLLCVRDTNAAPNTVVRSTRLPERLSLCSPRRSEFS
jgi:hypothetical protein